MSIQGYSVLSPDYRTVEDLFIVSDEITGSRVRELERMRDSFPSKIIYGAFNPKTEQWRSGAVPQVQNLKNETRENWVIVTLGKVSPKYCCIIKEVAIPALNGH